MNKKSVLKRINFAPYVMILPIIVLLAIFAFYPIALSIIKSTYRWSGTFNKENGINEFIFFKNYSALLKDEIFWTSWKNTVFFVVSGAVVNMIFPFLCSDTHKRQSPLLHQKQRQR